MSVLMSSHVLSEPEGACDHLVLLADGRVPLSGPVDELLDAHRVLVGSAGLDLRAAVAGGPGAGLPAHVAGGGGVTWLAWRRVGASANAVYGLLTLLLRRYYAPPLVVPEEQPPGQVWPVGHRQYDDLVDGEVLGRVLVSHHPDSRFWPFRFVELGLFLVLAAVLLAVGRRVVDRGPR
ncbi:hypothetical protein APASM_0102 [Actinosynnema pretiosum subsp. pretiosum]|nr:hypothetical protein APASM_0102 [Actinosynnema pretiosum subsp. pretiosum]